MPDTSNVSQGVWQGCGPPDLHFIHDIRTYICAYVIACTVYLCKRIHIWMFSILEYVCVDVQYTGVCMCGCSVY